MATRQTTSLPVTKLPVAKQYDSTTETGNWDRSRKPIRKIVIHTIVGTIQGATARFNNAGEKASAHYGVGLDGQLYQWVSEDCTAYHAGRYTMNQESIGIEHEDKGDYNGPRTEALYQAAGKLVRDICLFYGLPITRETIIGHKEVPSPTACPDSLDVERIVRLAQQNEAQMSDDEARAVKFLKESFDKLFTLDAEKFGNLEGMSKYLVDMYQTYYKLFRPYRASGKEAVVIDKYVLEDIAAKASNVEAIAQYMGFTQSDLTNPDLSSLIIELLSRVRQLYGADVFKNAKDPGIPTFPDPQPDAEHPVDPGTPAIVVPSGIVSELSPAYANIGILQQDVDVLIARFFKWLRSLL